MALSFYYNYLTNIAQPPYEQHIANLQNAINQTWKNSTQNTNGDTGIIITQQSEIGSNIYNQVDISVDMQIDMGTGLKKSDDWKIFSHRLLTDVTQLGLMYQWNNNYWITTNIDEYGSPIKSASVRRCNNFLKWIDRNDGSLKSYPCIVDYDLSGTSPKYDKDINTPNGHFVCIVQGNSDTLSLRQNQRFVFNGQAFKLTGYNNMLQNSMVDNTTTLLYFDMYLDMPQEDDDLVDNVANATEYVYEMQVSQDIFAQIQGFSGQLFAQIYLNGDNVQRQVIWSSDDNGIINQDGVYTLIGDVGSTAHFYCKFGDILHTISIDIVDTPQNNYEIIISPLVQELSQGQSVNMTANLYNNGVLQDAIVTASVSGADSVSCYKFINVGNNTFMLENVFRSITPLVITFNTEFISLSTEIKLKAMF